MYNLGSDIYCRYLYNDTVSYVSKCTEYSMLKSLVFFCVFGVTDINLPHHTLTLFNIPVSIHLMGIIVFLNILWPKLNFLKEFLISYKRKRVWSIEKVDIYGHKSYFG